MHESVTTEWKLGRGWLEFENGLFRRLDRQCNDFCRYAVGFWNSSSRHGSLILGMDDSGSSYPIDGFNTPKHRDQFRLQLNQLLDARITPAPSECRCQANVYFLPVPSFDEGVVIQIDFIAPPQQNVVFSTDGLVYVRWGPSLHSDCKETCSKELLL